MKNFLNRTLLAGLVAIGTTTASATILVDDFDTPDGGHCVQVGAALCSILASSDVDEREAAGAIGGVRYIEVNLDGATGGTASANFVPTGAYNLSINAAASGFGLVAWDAVNDGAVTDPGALGLDGSTVTSIDFVLLATDLAASFEFTICDSDGDCIVSSPFSTSVNGFHSIALSSFGPNALFDLDSIGSIQMKISSDDSVDVLIDRVSLGEVPEPGTYALMGAGLLSLALYRRRRSA